MDKIGNIYIPRIVFIFVTSFWLIGLTKYNDPDLSLGDVIISPIGLVGFSLIFIILGIFSCCCKDENTVKNFNEFT